MSHEPMKVSTVAPRHDRRPDEAVRRPYATPRLERLGAWSSLTLQQSVPIGPGGFGSLPDPERMRRLG